MDVLLRPLEPAGSIYKSNFGTNSEIEESANFSHILNEKFAKEARKFKSGQIEICLDNLNLPSTVNFYDESGKNLGCSSFSAPEILRITNKHGIPLEGLRDLGRQLDAAGIGYRPYELYRGTGSDHGIDFEDLIAGGLGTAYDWRVDPNVELKGESAVLSLQADRALALNLDLKINKQVTHGRGIDPNYFESQEGRDGVLRNFVSFNGGTASWYSTAEEARNYASATSGTTIDLGQPVSLQNLDQVSYASLDLNNDVEVLIPVHSEQTLLDASEPQTNAIDSMTSSFGIESNNSPEERNLLITQISKALELTNKLNLNEELLNLLDKERRALR